MSPGWALACGAAHVWVCAGHQRWPSLQLSLQHLTAWHHWDLEYRCNLPTVLLHEMNSYFFHLPVCMYLTVMAANVAFCRSLHGGSQRDLFRMWEGCGVWLLYPGPEIMPFPKTHPWAGGVNTSGKITSLRRAVLHDCQHNLTRILKQTNIQKPLTKKWTIILQNTCPVLNRLLLTKICRCRNITLEYTRRCRAPGRSITKYC